ncbi:hypothetical protein HZB01_04745 [Candidatus Woesearchaeota archaeon]|nr:hypothetical protein [Candidatus Woesearchaeota archaeon]
MQNSRSTNWFIMGGVLLLAAILLVNSFFVFTASSTLDKRIQQAKELAKPAKIELVVLTTSCSTCFDINPTLAALKSENVEVTKEQSIPGDSDDAKALIEQYALTRIPAIIVRGEISKIAPENFAQRDNALIFAASSPPFVDAVTGSLKGEVSAIVINDVRCRQCSDMRRVVQSVIQNGVAITDQKLLDASDEEAVEFIQKMEIKKLPALLLSDDIDLYPIAANMRQSGLVAKDGYYLVESSAPYIEAETGNVRGLVQLLMVTDSSCSTCYDVTTHKGILARLGIAIDEEKTIDLVSSKGKELQQTYNLTLVPTIILQGDLAAYPTFDTIWKEVGTKESDGSYVFRKVNALGESIVYKDLVTGDITGQQAAASGSESGDSAS